MGNHVKITIPPKKINTIREMPSQPPCEYSFTLVRVDLTTTNETNK
jgi:hypothetical protein